MLAATFWNLEYIVDSARRAMEAAYLAEQEPAEQTGTVGKPLDASTKTLESSSIKSDVSDGDPLKIMQSALIPSASLQPSDRAAGDALDNLTVAMRKESLTSKQPTQAQASARPTSPWTSEIEAALRALLRPLSMNLRYEYAFSDMLNEKSSIDAMNSLFKQPAKPDDGSTRDISAGDEIRRKRSHELRRAGAQNTSIKRPDHTNR